MIQYACCLALSVKECTVVNKFFPCILLGVIFYTYHTHTDYFLNGLIIKTFNAVLVYVFIYVTI